ncbi:MAG: ZIP family metal transporter [Nitrospirota bacterium]
MLDSLSSLHPVLQALLATLFTWAMTALGAGVIFLRKELSRKMLDGMLGFAAGVMIAASYWSLLAPAIEMSEGSGVPAWFPAFTGFLLGGAFLRVVDGILPHLHVGFPMSEAEGISTTWKRTTLLVLAITLHNIPEGTAVSMPLWREGLSRPRSFWYGQLSGLVEPVAGVLGAAFVLLAKPLLPYALSFAAGAMIFVVVEEVVPESQRGGNADFATMGTMLGFAVMMFLDVGLG